MQYYNFSHGLFCVPRVKCYCTSEGHYVCDVSFRSRVSFNFRLMKKKKNCHNHFPEPHIWFFLRSSTLHNIPMQLKTSSAYSTKLHRIGCQCRHICLHDLNLSTYDLHRTEASDLVSWCHKSLIGTKKKTFLQIYCQRLQSLIAITSQVVGKC